MFLPPIELKHIPVDTNKCSIPDYNLLNDKEIELINQNSHATRYEKGQTIYRQHSPATYLMFVKSGLVKVYKENVSNKTIILKLSKENEYMGLIAIFGKSEYNFSASALCNTEIVFTDAETFLKVLRRNGAYSLKIMEKLSQDGLKVFDKLVNLSYKQLPGRIADILLYFSKDIFDSEEFEFPVTRQELAELASTTKESFIRTLSDFNHDKIISLNGRKVKINSLNIIEVLSRLG